MFFIYCIILLLCAYFIYLIVKYSGTEKPEYKLEYFRDKEYIKYPPIIVGYLDNKKIKEEHIIATALDFVTKRVIKIEKTADNTDYIFTITDKIEASEIEIEALKIFFNSSLKIGTKQTLGQFQKIIRNEKIFGNYGKLKRSFNTKIREYFDKKQDVKQITRNTNIKNILLFYFLFVIICSILQAIDKELNIKSVFVGCTIAFSLFIEAIYLIKLSLLGNFSWTVSAITIALFVQTLFFILAIIDINNLFIILLILIIMGIIILFDDMLQRRKTNLANAYEMIKGLKRYIIDYSNIDEYDIYHTYLWDEYYVYAVALNIKKI